MPGKIVIAASLAQKPLQGGHAWVLLQYLLGFRKLGWDVLFLDALEPDMCFDQQLNPCSLEQSVNLKVFLRVMTTFDLQDAFSLFFNKGEKCIGKSRRQVLNHVRHSEVLINIMGYFSDEQVLAQARKRAFLDIDPGFGQMWESLGLAHIFHGYDFHVTIGENIGKQNCCIPSCGLEWITTPQPVVLDYWPPVFFEENTKMTSVASWRGAYGPVEYQGKSYGLRAHEGRKFASLPSETDQEFQLALSIHPDDAKDIQLLRGYGWQLVDPLKHAGDPWTYQAYIQKSASEFMTAKNMYVDTQSGWFSDRSICYLSSGKPVLAQDTGLGSLFPVGEGLLLFETLDDAVGGVEELRGNYKKHALAARAIAEQYFDSDKVLDRLLGKLGVS